MVEIGGVAPGERKRKGPGSKKRAFVELIGKKK